MCILIIDGGKNSMEATLTVKSDKTAVDSAKRYARPYNRDFSTRHKKHSPVVESLTGVLTEDELEKFAKEDDRARYILKAES